MLKVNLFIKRLIDILGSLAGIIILLPLLIVFIILIKLTSKGPVFFVQKRLGKDGKEFNIIKFRTMVINAEQMGSGLFVYDESDSRITRVGRFLRATSLDELPQLFNVLTGDMSLVGPRPPVPYHPYKYDEYSEFQRRRFAMRPGITGLTQVTVRNSVSWDDRIVIDVQYVDKYNLLLDLKILIMTLVKVVRPESLYRKFDKDAVLKGSGEVRL